MADPQQSHDPVGREKTSGRGLRVMAIGGGTGLSTLLKGLKHFVSLPVERSPSKTDEPRTHLSGHDFEYRTRGCNGRWNASAGRNKNHCQPRTNQGAGAGSPRCRTASANFGGNRACRLNQCGAWLAVYESYPQSAG